MIIMTIRLLACGLLLLTGTMANAADLKPDTDGYINHWLVLEGFELGDKASDHSEESQKNFLTQEAFANEFKAQPKDGDKVKITLPEVTSTEVTWKAREGENGVLNFDEVDNVMFISVVYITSDVEITEAKLSIGSDDSSSWRINGTEVLAVYEGRGVEPDANESSPFTLVKGTNVILASVINGSGPSGLSARILDKTGTPVKNVVVSLTPPPAK
jgi:hypothetical protein